MRHFFLLLTVVAILLIGCAGEPPTVDNIPAVVEHTIDVEGVEINYFEFHPAAGGLPVLYLHGYSGCGYEAYYFQDDLADRHIIAPDLPGLGRSGKPEVDYDLSYFLAFVRNFVRTLGLDQFVLIGHSMGGKIATAYAALYGSNGFIQGTPGDSEHQHVGFVDKLILMAPYGLDREAGDIIEFLSNTGELVDASFHLHNQTLLDVVIRLEVFHDPEKIPQELVDYIASATFYSDRGVAALANITRNTIARDSLDWLLPEVTVPTLIIWGENDRVLDFKHAATFDERIPDSRLVSVPDCGHMPHIEQQAITAAAIEEFLGGS